MAGKEKMSERKREIISFFYIVFGQKVHKGTPPDEARKETYDAVTLRYGIGRERLLNIISMYRGPLDGDSAAFRANAMNLISDLHTMNDGLEEAKGRNNKLITLLEEICDGPIK